MNMWIYAVLVLLLVTFAVEGVYRSGSDLHKVAQVIMNSTDCPEDNFMRLNLDHNSHDHYLQIRDHGFPSIWKAFNLTEALCLTNLETNDAVKYGIRLNAAHINSGKTMYVRKMASCTIGSNNVKVELSLGGVNQITNSYVPHPKSAALQYGATVHEEWVEADLIDITFHAEAPTVMVTNLYGEVCVSG